MALSSVQSATAYGAGQLQRQVAIRNAEQLQAKAQTLAAQAAQAREDAKEAVRQADTLNARAGTARTAADYAVQAVLAGEGAREMGKKISEQADRIYQSLQSDDNANKLYARNGSNSGSSYTAGSIFKFAG